MSEKKCIVSAEMRTIIDTIYPVGSYFWSSENKDPSTFLGGTWEQVKDRFVLAAGDTYEAGSTGGEATHKLTTNEMPSHSHSASTNSAGNHNHKVNSQTTAQQGNSSYGLPVIAGYAGVVLVSSGTPGIETTYNGSHSHSVTVNSTGGSAAHNNMPPYITAYCWHRTA